MQLKNRPFTSRKIVLGAIALVSLAGLTVASAQTTPNFSWTGGASVAAPASGAWSISTNWAPVGPPASSDTVAIGFAGSGGTGYTSTNDLGEFIFGTVVLNSTATVSPVITGDALAVGNAGSRIEQNGTGAFEIQNPITSSSFGTFSSTELGLFGNGAGFTTLSGTISDRNVDHDLGVFKNGASTFILTGNNTYSRGTTVSGGTLLVNNSAGSGTGTGTVIVNNGGTLGGDGAITVTAELIPANNTVTVNTGGTVAPGSGPNTIGPLTMTATSVIFSNGSTLLLDLSGATNDLLSITGTLDLTASGDQLQLNVLSPLTESSYHLVTGGLAGQFNTVTGIPDGYTLLQTPLGIDLQMTPVPETSTWVVGTLAVVAICITQRRRFLRLRRR